LPGLPDMSRCQNNVCNKNQKVKSYHNAVLHTAPESGPDLPAFPAGTGTTDVGPLSPRPGSDAQWRILPWYDGVWWLLQAWLGVCPSSSCKMSQNFKFRVPKNLFLRSTTIRALEDALRLLSKNGQYGRPMLGCPSLPLGQNSTNPIIS
jgi:hypothetical protein